MALGSFVLWYSKQQSWGGGFPEVPVLGLRWPSALWNESVCKLAELPDLGSEVRPEQGLWAAGQAWLYVSVPWGHAV